MVLDKQKSQDKQATLNNDAHSTTSVDAPTSARETMSTETIDTTSYLNYLLAGTTDTNTTRPH
jgi:hypothetical protein